MIKFYPTEFAGSHEIVLSYFNAEYSYFKRVVSQLRLSQQQQFLSSLNYIQSCVGFCVKTASTKSVGQRVRKHQQLMLSTSIAFAAYDMLVFTIAVDICSEEQS